MNRKRKSTEILAQLGEPLPLPYRANQTRVKSESFQEEIPSSSHTSDHEPIRRRRGLERRDFSNPRTENVSTRDAPEHMPLPIWRRDRINVPPLFEEVAEPAYEHENTAESESILGEIQSQLDLLKSLYDSPDAIDADRKKFLKVSGALQQIIDQKQQESIVLELERIQRQNLVFLSSSSWYTSWKLWFSILMIFLLLLSSFIAGQMSYEYCYYLC